VTSILSDVQRTLKVGTKSFPERRWREALLYYLFGIWGEREDVMSNPLIELGGVTIRLNTNAGEYHADGTSIESLEDPHLSGEFSFNEVLLIGYEQELVENALVRFVKNNRIRVLHIEWPPYSGEKEWKKVYIWKKDRAHLGISRDCKMFCVSGIMHSYDHFKKLSTAFI
jgi:hypothetical protein